MPRRQYVADLQQAQSDLLPAGIHDLQTGEDDGQFEFLFSNGDPSSAIKVTALIPELSDYPKSHEYMIFSGEDAPPHIAKALQNVRRTNGKTVFELLDIVSVTLEKLSADPDGDTEMPESQLDYEDQSEEENDFDDDDIYDSDHEAFQNGTTETMSGAKSSSGASMKPADRAFRARLRSDLRLAKEAGFKVGILGHALDGFNAFVTLSIRISKLGISEEAMEAWQVTASDYLILILQFPNGYKTNEELQGFDSIRLQSNIGIRVCAGKSYKPTLQEAIKAFTIIKKNARDSLFTSDLPKPEEEVAESSIKETFISKPLNGLLQERLATLLRFRSAGMSWSGAEEHYSNVSSTGSNVEQAVPDRCFEPDPVNPALPQIMHADHLADRGRTTFSFPLLAMQFLLRHFVRCTEFCLVCHKKMNTELEAIKPYVCESELCLYQYMTLGFGPSIEHEILAQPYVVDLLISFCYKSAVACKLKEYPDGLSLAVPPSDPACAVLEPYHGRYMYGTQPQTVASVTSPVAGFHVGFDRDRLELIFHNKPERCPVKRGDWIVLKMSNQVSLQEAELHCRVDETSFFPTITISKPVVLNLGGNNISASPHASTNGVSDQTTKKPASPAATSKWEEASFTVYDQDFKSMTVSDKSSAICRLLDTLPDVKTIQEYLTKNQPADLKNWVERISPAALSLLRWVIASNRACIIQVDGDNDASSALKKEERLSGMANHMQFRFAMGAPDKEQRFLNEARKTTNRLNLAVPTIFAWHGSPLHNWHMIIREGLHFKNTDHGRAYGHGVYHALDATTSSGYASMGGMGIGVNGDVPKGTWGSSVLRISSALALNEIVNAPAEFVSSKPYYVVAQLDWIQTRYLFVSCKPAQDTVQIGNDTPPQNALTQDASRIPTGTSGSVVIPAAAIKTHRMIRNERRPPSPHNPSPLKKLKALGGYRDQPIPIDDDDDTDSIMTTASDTGALFGEDPLPPTEPSPPPTPAKLLGPPTDYIPGQLDFSTLPLMPLPTYATSHTTKRLMKELQSCARVQDATPLADLGWSIDVAKIENAYQWIVELHSFHTFEIKGKKLPLAVDMAKQGVKSVVMEVRFNKDFPFSPPYVRVITPRFLGFNQGGGGHIVLGGAMCMELLTNTGWSSVSSMESVLMQIRLAIASEPFARLDVHAGRGSYGTGEAADGYVRACQTHGWKVPEGFREMAYGVPEGGGGRL
ncbi:uncharacterized protein LTR77_000564 [Saxophila tyrrhenica]|uniref:UBC core domain-containing protein n=1 Tax=Saxophila tyrrhenica TaxID=1690608 RepID=A0AAV9PPM6_9PEZI|nr:hypothetical protein LTR77_000564 [Saxophila tyrrhenica]